MILVFLELVFLQTELRILFLQAEDDFGVSLVSLSPDGTRDFILAGRGGRRDRSQLKRQTNKQRVRNRQRLIVIIQKKKLTLL